VNIATCGGIFIEYLQEIGLWDYGFIFFLKKMKKINAGKGALV